MAGAGAFSVPPIGRVALLRAPAAVGLCVQRPRDRAQLSMVSAAERDASTAALKKPTTLEGQAVPSSMEEAVRRFFFGEEHAPRFLVAMLLAASALRLGGWGGLPDVGALDLVVVAAVAVFWAFQEWWLHKFLLHAPFKWLGTDIHVAHHERAFYHVSIDSMSLVVPWFIAAASLSYGLLPAHLAVTATGSYTCMGLFYEFVHYLAHTKVQPKNGFLRNIKSHHMKHHLVDDRYWQTFSWTQIDSILGTAPDAKELQEMAARRRTSA
eukprot:Tamp_27214.p1 GENE.Tamp_27214~~Tamp_27214.p1  ORF type:complete len:283 (+),score=45.85 Tamp_27214:50-850(+)